MSGTSLAFACALILGASAAARAQEPAPDQTLDRMRAVLQHKPLRLTAVEPEATFKIEIHAIHPMHEIFEKPPWQLPPIVWHIPAMGPATAFGSIPFATVDLLGIGRSVAAARHARDERAARIGVQREIAAYCAAQPNANTIQICSTAPAIR
jgi:hypothetical protein